MLAADQLADRRILLIITGGIAAYKSLLLIRLLRQRGAHVRCVLTEAATQFVTPLSVAALTEDKVYQDLFSLTDESEMGHIQLSRAADLVVVAPATADILAKLTHGLAGDLASTVLLATDKPVLVAPAMNVRMWHHPATQANLTTLAARGTLMVGPGEGSMACGEYGAGRMAEPEEIVAAIERCLAPSADAPRPALVDQRAPLLDPAAALGAPATPMPDRRLNGRRALVTAGPTREPIDPVRYISNHSSGKQGYAIAASLARHGAEVTLVTGPTAEPPPAGVEVVAVDTAEEMLVACRAALPADVAVFAAAVSDWRVVSAADQKLKKGAGGPPTIALAENPDVLATIAQLPEHRPPLVIGFAAETEKVVEHARAKLARKRCDWVLANDVSPATGTFGGADNTIHLIRADGSPDETWPTMAKAEVAERLAAAVADHFDRMPANRRTTG